MTEEQKMLAALPYNPLDVELVQARKNCKQLLKTLNTVIYESGRENSILLKQLLPKASKDILIEPPFHCDYGTHIITGKRVFINVNCVFLDAAEITMGNHVMIGPNVQLYTATHPSDAEARKTQALAKPILIGDNVWIGGGAIILPGIKIGNNAVVAAGAVVTKDVAENTVVAGNPARKIKALG